MEIKNIVEERLNDDKTKWVRESERECEWEIRDISLLYFATYFYIK